MKSLLHRKEQTQSIASQKKKKKNKKQKGAARGGVCI